METLPKYVKASKLLKLLNLFSDGHFHICLLTAFVWSPRDQIMNGRMNKMLYVYIFWKLMISRYVSIHNLNSKAAKFTETNVCNKSVCFKVYINFNVNLQYSKVGKSLTVERRKEEIVFFSDEDLAISYNSSTSWQIMTLSVKIKRLLLELVFLSKCKD